MSSSPSPRVGQGRAGRPLGLAVLGSTGSIGRQVLDVVAGDPGIRVVALVAGRNRTLLDEQVARFDPLVASLGGGLEAAAVHPEVDLVVVGTTGIVSLGPILASLEAGKVVATANKETLVAAGHLVMPLARRRAGEVATKDPRDPLADALGWVRPIDSEHSAIWQCLVGEDRATVDGLILTASGGPFLDLAADELAGVTPERALRHPTWNMGPKITVDSATLANKGLEIVEAHWLYDAPYDAIEVVIHPQSIVHSAVRFSDGSIKAQLGTPDMRLPIQYALTYPRRRPSPASAADLVAAGRLDFRAPDEARFPALRIAREAGRLGPRATGALIAADDVAVNRFLAGSLGFTGIPALLAAAVERFGTDTTIPTEPSLPDVLALDAAVRAWAETWRPA